MAEVSPFRGIRYQPERVQLESVLSPPYDVISPELQLELYGRAMQNIVRIELGRSFEGDVAGERDRYTRARAHLDAWLAQGVLARDERPCLYVHRHSFRPPGGGGPRQRLGCFAGLAPVAHDRGEVLRHELTMSAPRLDRERLLREAKVQTSPVLLLYQGQAAVTRELEGIATAAPVAEAVIEGEYGPERHQLWVTADPGSLRRICDGLSSTRLFIADGHHRYETALTLGLSRLLVLLSPLESDGNVILPTHRIVPGARVDLAELGERVGGHGWQVTAVEGVAPLLRRMEQLRGSDHAIGVGGAGGELLLQRPRDPKVVDPRLRLDVSVLESEILEPCLGVAAADSEAGRLVYTRDPEAAVAEAARQEGLAFLLNATNVDEVAAVALGGETMPQKSTYFFPKVPAGLVLMDVD